MRKLQARVVELEGAKVEAEKKAEPTPEMRADMAIRSGQWPEAQRSVLVSRYTEGKPVHLFAERTFVARSATFTSGAIQWVARRTSAARTLMPRGPLPLPGPSPFSMKCPRAWGAATEPAKAGARRHGEDP